MITISEFQITLRNNREQDTSRWHAANNLTNLRTFLIDQTKVLSNPVPCFQVCFHAETAFHVTLIAAENAEIFAVATEHLCGNFPCIFLASTLHGCHSANSCSIIRRNTQYISPYKFATKMFPSQPLNLCYSELLKVEEKERSCLADDRKLAWFSWLGREDFTSLMCMLCSKAQD